MKPLLILALGLAALVLFNQTVGKTDASFISQSSYLDEAEAFAKRAITYKDFGPLEISYQTFVHGSDVCEEASVRGASLSQGETSRNFDKILRASQAKKMMTAYNYFEENIFALVSMGHDELFLNVLAQDKIQDMKAKCSAFKPGSHFNLMFETLRDSVDKIQMANKDDGGGLNESSHLLLKKYLMAFYEYTRLSLTLGENGYKDPILKKQAENRRRRILEKYPLVIGGNLIQADLTRFILYPGQLYRQKHTFAHIDDFLFGEGKQSYNTPEDSDDPGTLIYNKMMEHEALPEYLHESLIASLERGLSPVMEGLTKYCALPACEQVKVAPSDIEEHVNRSMASFYQKNLKRDVETEKQELYSLIKPICECELDSKEKFAGDKTQWGLAGSIVGSAALCIFVPVTAPVSCPALVFSGYAATTAGVVNTMQALARTTQQTELISILEKMPDSSKKVIADLKKVNDGYRRQLLEDALWSTSGVAVARAATAFASADWENALDKAFKSIYRTAKIISPVGSKILVKRITGDGKIAYSLGSRLLRRRLRMDQTGYAMVAGDKTGRAVAKEIIESGDKTVVFIDVNFLGVVNYFKNMTQDGDTYLREVVREIADEVAKAGDKGAIFRWGGDEFVLSVDAPHPKYVEELSKKIAQAVSKNPVIIRMFDDHFKFVDEWYQALKQATSVDTIPAKIRKILSEEELKFANRDFSGFKKRFEELGGRYIDELEATKQSISIGAHREQGRGMAATLKEAEAIASDVKKKFKKELGAVGATEFKYGRPEILPPEKVGIKPKANRDAEPEVQPTRSFED